MQRIENRNKHRAEDKKNPNYVSTIKRMIESYKKGDLNPVDYVFSAKAVGLCRVKK